MKFVVHSNFFFFFYSSNKKLKPKTGGIGGGMEPNDFVLTLLLQLNKIEFQNRKRKSWLIIVILYNYMQKIFIRKMGFLQNSWIWNKSSLGLKHYVLTCYVEISINFQTYEKLAWLPGWANKKVVVGKQGRTRDANEEKKCERKPNVLPRRHDATGSVKHSNLT